jgi:hypothetical protein
MEAVSSIVDRLAGPREVSGASGASARPEPARILPFPGYEELARRRRRAQIAARHALAVEWSDALARRAALRSVFPRAWLPFVRGTSLAEPVRAAAPQHAWWWD